MVDNKANNFLDQRLSTVRENELLQSFVRVNIDETDNNENEKEIRKSDDTTSIQVKKELKEIKRKSSKKTQSASTVSASSSTTITIQSTPKLTKKKFKLKRRRRQGPKHEELYCDKDRAAAVNMGSKDIKQSLKMKRKEDRTKALQIPEESEPSTFLALGNYEMCKCNYNIAIDFIFKALELNPNDKGALVARSKCYILLGQPEKALKDAETALKIDKTFIKAIYQKAEALYYLGDFEHSLMYFHRGLHIRPDHEDFKLGVHKAQKAIENAIGSTISGLNGNLIFPSLITTTTTTTTTSTTLSNSSRHSSTTNYPKTKQKLPLKSKSAKNKSRLLRELAPDKDYLDNLMNNPNIKCKFKEDDTTITNFIKTTVDYLNARQEFWRQQLPPNLK